MASSFGRAPDAVSNLADPARSAVNWAPALAGAAVALATTLILAALGSGLGFAAASPWPGSGASVTTFAVGIGIWLIVTQWLSSFMGGYIAGRLRTKWVGVHSHEVFFRDTAHGLLAWAVATGVMGAVALSATASAAGAAADATSATVSYATDAMLRSDRADANASSEMRSEIGRLLSRGDELQAGDRNYIASRVAAQTGISAQEARQRVDAAALSIRVAADKARKASSALGFFTALSMLIGAFIASVAAAYGGQLRDKDADRVD
ncbi:hypothetical protein [Flavisphingomonas formosensis]|uniref:hypothetical protein n=1 Tax=Flavisphingomonas formosensis TaxID=861534 RepID=UPI0012FC2CDF|nr:hypothetical protein [Sphingomonas formosensis]